MPADAERMTGLALPRPLVLAAVLTGAACTSSEHRPPPSPPPLPLQAAQPKKDAAPADPADDAAVALPIPPRHHAAEAPPEGWCGETAIQEALLYLGIWAPQELIHRWGRSVHPDLYSNEIPVALGALAALGVEQTAYTGGEPYGRFVRRALDDGAPVIAGVKILPTQHPEWGLDHFVLAVGYGDRGILVDTTWGYREWLDEAKPKTRGLSLGNAFYAIRLGRRTPPARLVVLEERGDVVRLNASCVGRVERAAISGERASQTWESNGAVVDVVPARKAFSYTCVR